MNKVYVGLLCVLLVGRLQAQIKTACSRACSINPYTVGVSDVMTTNMIFPYAVTRVHCASKELQVEQMKDVKNIILVRSVTQGFSPTNLSVVTNDGQFYSFCLEYSARPAVLNIQFEKDTVERQEVIAKVPVNEAELEKSVKVVSQQERTIRAIKRNQRVSMRLSGIFMHNQLMWFVINVDNPSLVDYQVDYLKLFVRDRRKSKKTIVQEREIQTVFMRAPENVLPGQSAKYIIGVEPFCIAFDKILAIQLAEKNGARSMELRTTNNVFTKTRAIINY